MTFTDYYFDCSNEGLDGALERLAEFFISPLFTISKTDAEIQVKIKNKNALKIN